MGPKDTALAQARTVARTSLLSLVGAPSRPLAAREQSARRMSRASACTPLSCMAREWLLGMSGGGRRAGSRASKGRKHLTNHHIHLVKVGGGISTTFRTPPGRSLQHSHAAAPRAPAPCPEHILTPPPFISQAASGASAER